jgi:hypothetical protein
MNVRTVQQVIYKNRYLPAGCPSAETETKFEKAKKENKIN